MSVWSLLYDKTKSMKICNSLVSLLVFKSETWFLCFEMNMLYIWHEFVCFPHIADHIKNCFNHSASTFDPLLDHLMVSPSLLK